MSVSGTISAAPNLGLCSWDSQSCANGWATRIRTQVGYAGGSKCSGGGSSGRVRRYACEARIRVLKVAADVENAGGGCVCLYEIEREKERGIERKSKREGERETKGGGGR